VDLAPTVERRRWKDPRLLRGRPNPEGSWRTA